MRGTMSALEAMHLDLVTAGGFDQLDHRLLEWGRNDFILLAEDVVDLDVVVARVRQLLLEAGCRVHRHAIRPLQSLVLWKVRECKWGILCSREAHVVVLSTYR